MSQPCPLPATEDEGEPLGVKKRALGCRVFTTPLYKSVLLGHDINLNMGN